MSVAGEVRLNYAIQNEKIVSVESFAHLAGHRSRYPDDFYCPECDGRIMLKLSPEHKKADHFAHYPESDCPLRGSPESAAHLNAKLYLAQRLSQYRRASLHFKCKLCQKLYAYLRILEYDAVVPELKLENRRPDVSCLRDGETIGAIEVFYTHAVNAEKQYDLNQTRIPWFEIPALNVLPQYFHTIESRGIISISAAEAGVIYPRARDLCDTCKPIWAKQQEVLREQRAKQQEVEREQEHLNFLRWAKQQQEERDRRALEREREVLYFIQWATQGHPQREIDREWVKRQVGGPVERFHGIDQGRVFADVVMAIKKERLVPIFDNLGPCVTADMSDTLWLAVALYRYRSRSTKGER